MWQRVCGYVYEGRRCPLEFCPVCKAPASKFQKQDEEMSWAAEHVVGVAQGVSEDILADLRANFQGECTEVGMYLAMARVAHREGYPRSACTGRRPLTKRRSTPRSLRSCSARSSPTARRRTSRCAWRPRTAQLPAKFDLRSAQRLRNLDDSRHRPRWRATKPRHGKAFAAPSRDTSAVFIREFHNVYGASVAAERPRVIF